MPPEVEIIKGYVEYGIALGITISLLIFFVKKVFKLIEDREQFQQEIILQKQLSEIECQSIVKQNQTILLSNQEIVKECTHIMSTLAGKYDDLKDVVNSGFMDIKTEINEVYKLCLKDGD